MSLSIHLYSVRADRGRLGALQVFFEEQIERLEDNLERIEENMERKDEDLERIKKHMDRTRASYGGCLFLIERDLLFN